MVNEFQDQVVLITGAAGGIGAATAELFAADGARLALLDRDSDGLAAVAQEATSRGASEVLVLPVDQTDGLSVGSAIDEVTSVLGEIGILFANAGYGKFSPFLTTSADQWERHVKVNMTGTFNVCQRVAKAMVLAGNGGSIVVNASSGAVLHSDQLSAYCATKAAVRMLAMGMASELGIYRIRVNIVMPGVIESPMTSPMLDSELGHRDVLLAETPVGRLGVPNDVAEAVYFLSSRRAGFVTGSSLMLDGGQTLHGHPRWFRLDYRRAFEEEWEVGR